MRAPRQLKRLCQLADDEFFSAIAEGVSLIVENAQTYLRASEALAPHLPGRAVEHLRLTAEEEAAKVLILLDAVRCPRGANNDVLRSRTLGYFTNHLARGVYAWYASNRPATFDEACEIVEAALRDRYYDGPDEDEFECRNWILSHREDNLYVDYVEDDGRCYWASPKEMYAVVGQQVGYSMVMNLVESLWRLGCGTADGIRIVANTWRPIMISKSGFKQFEWLEYQKHIIQMLESLRLAGLSDHASDADSNVVVEGWNYPLYSLDLRTEIT
jgi:hypothetical protein